MAKTHGMTNTKVYRVWWAMKERCNDPKNKQYKDYGGRGITVDPKWDTFSGFWEDMQEGYEEGLTLDRINNDEGYTKSNCRWADRATQRRNGRRVVNIDTPWGRMCVTDAAAKAGIPRATLQSRVNAGWPQDKLFSTKPWSHKEPQK